MKRTKAWLMIGLALILALSCLPGTALAYDPIDDLDQPCSLTINSQYAGIVYDVYRVCEMDEYAIFTPTGDFVEEFDKICLLIEGKQWNTLTSEIGFMLDAWAADGYTVEPDATATTGSNKSVVVENLLPGLYFVRGRELKVGSSYYKTTDFLISLPDWVADDELGNGNGTSGTWIRDATANNSKGSNKNNNTSVHVLKVWRGDGEEERPTEVTVRLLRRSRATQEVTVYDTVVLNSGNSWSYTWSKLDYYNYDWIVQEVDIEGDYVPVTTREGVNFVITNYFTPLDDIPDETPPLADVPNIPDVDIPDPDVPLVSPPPDDLTEIKDPDVPLATLPQTGMLWWPVPILAMSGMFLFILGWGIQRRNSSHED